MGKTFLQRRYLLVSPLVMLPNSVVFNVKLLKFSAVVFSILMKTVSGFDEVFVQAISKNTKTIKVIGNFFFIFSIMTPDQYETLHHPSARETPSRSQPSLPQGYQ